MNSADGSANYQTTTTTKNQIDTVHILIHEKREQIRQNVKSGKWFLYVPLNFEILIVKC